jgi:hypothetical protein
MLSLIPFAAPAADNLAQVRAGFGSREIDFSNVRLAVGILLAIVIAAVAVAVIRRALRVRKDTSGWSSITRQSHIWDIMNRAVARQASVLMDLYRPSKPLNYKGSVDSLEDGGGVMVVTLTETPSLDLDFTDMPGIVHMNFSPGPKEPMEHYQFATKLKGGRYARTRTGIREAQLLIPVPRTLTSAQRRSFLRLEPQPPYALECRLHSVPEDGFPGLANLNRLTDCRVQDVSIGGCQLRIEPPAALKETQRFVGVIGLPTEDLGVQLKTPVLVILMQTLSIGQVESDDDSGQDPATLVRMRFLGRYLQDPLQKNWLYRGITTDTLDDLAHWLAAYQRHIIKKRNHSLPGSAGHRPPNMFPSTQPKRPPLRDT